MVNSEELTGTIEYLTLYTRCRINRVVITGFDCTIFTGETPAYNHSATRFGPSGPT
jgi:hypothetical protein